MLVTKKDKDTNDLLFEITLPTGKTFTDVEDVAFIVKSDIDDLLADAKIEKYLDNGDITLQNSNQILVHFTLSDYENMEIGYDYIAGLFCRFTGQTDFDERIDTFSFQIEKSMHNQIV